MKVIYAKISTPIKETKIRSISRSLHYDFDSADIS